MMLDPVEIIEGVLRSGCGAVAESFGMASTGIESIERPEKAAKVSFRNELFRVHFGVSVYGDALSSKVWLLGADRVPSASLDTLYAVMVGADFFDRSMAARPLSLIVFDVLTELERLNAEDSEKVDAWFKAVNGVRSVTWKSANRRDWGSFDPAIYVRQLPPAKRPRWFR